MIISEVIKDLERIKKDRGDLPCVIESELYHVQSNAPVTECSVEERGEFGLSVKFLI